MTVEERLDRNEANIQRLASVQDQMMDVLGLTLEGERRIATRTERLEETVQQFGEGLIALREQVHEIDGKLNALISVVAEVVRRRE
jgi:predicted  nucleic acid-binding Zn-ribbon protein